jgi:hypothetical protein
LLKFDGIDEILLLLPLQPKQAHTTDQHQNPDLLP